MAADQQIIPSATKLSEAQIDACLASNLFWARFSNRSSPKQKTEKRASQNIKVSDKKTQETQDKKVIEELKTKLKDVEEKLLRELAENDNLRKRHEKDYKTKNHNLGDGKGGHVQARSILGPVYDHIKGPSRKKTLRSPEARC